MKASKKQLTVNQRCNLLLLLLVFPIISWSEDWDQSYKLIPLDRHPNANFGFAVAISGDYLIVGAKWECYNTFGTDSLLKAGAAYIFVRSGDAWIQQQKLVASDRKANDAFGYAVAISGDYVIVGAPYNGGAAYIFKRDGNGWLQQQRLIPANDETPEFFGGAVAISGNYAIVGDRVKDIYSSTDTILNAGVAYIFSLQDMIWKQQQKLSASHCQINADFGSSVSLSGNNAIIGARYEDENADYSDSLDFGAAYIFARTDTLWTESARLHPPDLHSSDRFGTSVSISGDYAVAGSPFHEYDTSTVATSEAGAAYIYLRNGNEWILQQEIFDSTRIEGTRLGWSISLTGDYLVAGTNTNWIYLFTRSGSSWMFQNKIGGYSFDFSFGTAVSISGNHCIIGAYNSADSLNSAGVAYIYGTSSGTTVEHPAFSLPQEFRLEQNFPNPFNSTTIFSYSIAILTQVRLKIYDILGREIVTLVNKPQKAGPYHVTWDASNLPSGVYMYQIQAGSFSSTKKLILIK